MTKAVFAAAAAAAVAVVAAGLLTRRERRRTAHQRVPRPADPYLFYDPATGRRYRGESEPWLYVPAEWERGVTGRDSA